MAMDLNDEETATLIELYRSQENLYNNTLEEYNDREKIKESLKYIADVMDRGWNEKTTKARLKWLRNGYTRNRSLVENNKKPRWRWYHRLDSFLRPYCRLIGKGGPDLAYQEDSTLQLNQTTESTNFLNATSGDPASEDSPMPEQDDDLDPDPATCEQQVHSIIENYLARVERKRKPEDRHVGQVLSDLQVSVEKMKEDMDVRLRREAERKAACSPQSENEKYCIYVASLLDKLSKVNQIKTRKKIDDILFEVTMQEAEGTFEN